MAAGGRGCTPPSCGLKGLVGENVAESGVGKLVRGLDASGIREKCLSGWRKGQFAAPQEQLDAK